jgi:hypothetical protein
MIAFIFLTRAAHHDGESLGNSNAIWSIPDAAR